MARGLAVVEEVRALALVELARGLVSMDLPVGGVVSAKGRPLEDLWGEQILALAVWLPVQA
jgi:hypothetical protein